METKRNRIDSDSLAASHADSGPVAEQISAASNAMAEIGPERYAEHKDRLRGGSKSFFAASLLLPKSVAQPASVLYSYCRIADDAIDESDTPDVALAELHNRLDAIYRQEPAAHPVDEDFARLVADYQLPKALPLALLDGFAWDAQGRRYETIDDVIAYSARVASSVGVMMSVLMGVFERPVFARSADLGVAMQLTNIARDVGEDAANGRLYLPAQWIREAGVDPDEWLANPHSSPAITTVVERLLVVADEFYQRAGTGIPELPATAQYGIHCASQLYAQIGRQLERDGLDPVSGRAMVSTSRKILVMVGAISHRLKRIALVEDEPHPETAFLVDAAVQGAREHRSTRSIRHLFDPARAGLKEGMPTRLLGVLALFDRLAREDKRRVS